MPRRKGAKKKAVVVESPIIDEMYDDPAFGADPNAVAEAAAPERGPNRRHRQK